jgi:hypothetical protein
METGLATAEDDDWRDDYGNPAVGTIVPGYRLSTQ